MRFLLTNYIINSKFISFFFNLKLKNKYFNLFFFYLLLLLAFSLQGRERDLTAKNQCTDRDTNIQLTLPYIQYNATNFPKSPFLLILFAEMTRDGVVLSFE